MMIWKKLKKKNHTKPDVISLNQNITSKKKNHRLEKNKDIRENALPKYNNKTT